MTFKNAKSLTLMVFGGILSINQAFAIDVTYGTNPRFGNILSPCSACFISNSGKTLNADHSFSLTTSGVTDTGDPVNNPNFSVPTATVLDYATFAVVGPLRGAPKAPFTDTLNVQFLMDITQSSPVPAATPLTETISGVLSGTIQKFNSSLSINYTLASFSGAGTNLKADTDPYNNTAAFSFVLDGVKYWVDQTQSISPSSSTIPSVLVGAADSVAPEPSFYALTGTGFLGLLGMAIRRRKQQDQDQVESSN